MWWFKLAKARALASFQPDEMAAAQFATGDVIGDLGGVSVTIPKHFANYVEYEGDPGWGEKRKGPRPERTHASKMISFGFKVRFPDMAGLSNAALEADRRKQTIYNTKWLDVGINTGRNFPGTGFLDRRAAYITAPGQQFQYEMLPEMQYGMAVYSPAGTDAITGRPNREHQDAKDIFLHRNNIGQIDAYISCSNRAHGAAPCTHTFSLEPYMRAKVYVHYRRGLLTEWQQIQYSVAQLITSFERKRTQFEVGER